MGDAPGVLELHAGGDDHLLLRAPCLAGRSSCTSYSVLGTSRTSISTRTRRPRARPRRGGGAADPRTSRVADTGDVEPVRGRRPRHHRPAGVRCGCEHRRRPARGSARYSGAGPRASGPHARSHQRRRWSQADYGAIGLMPARSDAIRSLARAVLEDRVRLDRSLPARPTRCIPGRPRRARPVDGALHRAQARRGRRLSGRRSGAPASFQPARGQRAARSCRRALAPVSRVGGNASLDHDEEET